MPIIKSASAALPVLEFSIWSNEILFLLCASADAHNRDSISFDQMENSKTGKAAEADLIIGIGRNATKDTENKIRILCVSKNKINGYHGEPSCTIRRSISRYEV